MGQLDRQQDAGRLPASRVHRGTGIVLHADLVGFSSLARKAARAGPGGAEDLAEKIDLYFGTLIEAVRQNGGIVGGMVGDALSACWPEETDGAALLRAVHAARRAHEMLPPELSCRISLAPGPVELSCHTVAGGGAIWLMSGAALLRAASLNGQAPAARTVLDPRLAPLADESGIAIEPGPETSLLMRVPLPPEPLGNPPSERWPTPGFDDAPLSLLWQEMTAQSALSEIGTAFFRDLTILSIDLSEGKGAESLGADDLDARLRAVLAETDLWHGMPVNVLAEQKGVVLHVAFGLPPAGPEKRHSRALHAAIALARGKATAAMPSGVASGRMFVAAHGRAPFRAVSTFGWPSALATRLMETESDTVLIDEETAEAASESFDLRPRPLDTIKGARGPILAQEVTGRRSWDDNTPPVDLPELLADLIAGRSEIGSVVVRGAAGLGKSRLCVELAATAMAAGWRVSAPVPRPGAISEPFDGVQRVIANLGAAVPRSLDGSMVTTLSQALSQAIDRDGRPHLIIIDDADTLDPDSTDFLLQAARRGAFKVVLSLNETHPVLDDVGAEIRLAPLNHPSGRALICEAAQTGLVEREALDLLMRRSEGNPGHLRELVKLLLERGDLIRDGGVLRLVTDGARALSEGPTAAQGLADLAQSRLDTLPPDARWIMSIAAVIGEPFTLDVAGPLSGLGAERMGEGVNHLVADGLLRRDGTGALSVPSAVMRSVAYETLPYKTRQKLHLRIAQNGTAGDLALEARHWSGAGFLAEAITCHERMARDAHATHAYRTAIAHAAEARRLARRTMGETSPERLHRLALIEGTAALEDVELSHAQTTLTGLLSDLDIRIPSTRPRLASDVLGALSRQVRHRLAPPRPRADERRAMAAQARRHLAEIAYFDGRIDMVLLHTLHSLNDAERTGSLRETVAGYSAMSIGLETAGLRSAANGYDRRARLAAEQGANSADIAFAGLVSMVLHAGRADWDVACRAGRLAADLYRDIGAEGRWQQTAATLVHVDLSRRGGTEAEHLHADLDASADMRTSVQIRVWSLWARLLRGMRHAALPDVARLDALASLLDHPKLNDADRLGALCIVALGRMRQGNSDAARHLMCRALALGRSQPPAAWHVCNALSALSIVAALLDTPTEQKRRLSQARRIIARAARTLPVARVALSFTEALQVDATGRTMQASRQWRRMEQASRTLDLADPRDLLRQTRQTLSD